MTRKHSSSPIVAGGNSGGNPTVRRIHNPTFRLYRYLLEIEIRMIDNANDAIRDKNLQIIYIKIEPYCYQDAIACGILPHSNIEIG